MFYFIYLFILCRYEIGGEKTFFVVLLELFFFFFLVMYGRHLLSIYCCNFFVKIFNGFNSIIIFYLLFRLYR